MDDGGDTLVQDPVNQGKDRQTKPIGPRNENNTQRKDGTAEGLVKILGVIELATLAEWTSFENGDEVDLSGRFGALGAGKGPLPDLRIKALFTLTASEGDGLFQRARPNFMK